MTYRKWVKARSWREFHADDMIAEHNALYDAWQAAEAEAERLGRANSDLCDQIAAMLAARAALEGES